MRIRGTVKSVTKTTAKQRKLASKENPEAVTNKAGGVSFRSIDPALRLINRIGVPNFNEPTFYGKSGDSVIKDRKSLSDVAQSIIADSEELAQSDPQLLLSLAWWSREDAKVRTTPVVMLAVAARFPETRKYLRKYIAKIITRADQIKDLWAIYDLLYCRDGRDFNVTLKRAVTDVFGAFSEKQFLKYNNKNFPTFGDILRMTNYGVLISKQGGVKVRQEKLRKEIKDYLVYGTVTDEKKTPIIAARDKFNKAEKFDAAAKQNAIKSKANWEVVVSKFGNSKEVWEFLLDNNLVYYMAMLLNLRNILAAKVAPKYIDVVCAKLVDGAVTSKQMPTAFYSAISAIEQGFEFGRGVVKEYNPDQASVRKVQKALNDAVAAIKATLPRAGGSTAIFVDNSGSMTQSVSGGTVRICDAAAMLAVMAMETSDEVDLYAFGTDVAEVKYRQGDSFATLKEQIQRANTRGMATNGYRCVEVLLSAKKKVDRVILLTDCELYNSNDIRIRDPYLAQRLQTYREQVNPDVWLYVVNVCGSSSGSAPVGVATKNVALLSGHSEAMLEMAIISENGGSVKTATGEVVKIDPMPVIDIIRTKFTLVKETI